MQAYHCDRSYQCIAYCPLLTVCSLCYNWRPHCWAATAVHHCTWLFVTSLPGYDHPPLCSTSFTKSLLTQREHGRRPLDLYRQALPVDLHTTNALRFMLCCCTIHAYTMAGTMVEEPFKTVALPPPGLGDRPPCSRTGFGQTDQGSAHCVGRTNASSACSSSGIDYPRPLSISPHDAHERRGRCQIPLRMSTHLPPMTAGCAPSGRTGSRLAIGGFRTQSVPRPACFHQLALRTWTHPRTRWRQRSELDSSTTLGKLR